MAITIGITEQGDGGLDLSWADKLNNISGAIIITKNLNPACKKQLLKHKDKVILHCGCTGMGQSVYEPNVPHFRYQIFELMKLISKGFDPSHIVLRIDPILPTVQGLLCTKAVLDHVQGLQKTDKLPELRIRISVMDCYPHVRQRFTQADIPVPYTQFYANKFQMRQVTNLLSQYPYVYETCAEKYLNSPIYKQTGCVSEQDLKILNITPDKNFYTNPQNRNGCLCLSCKRELLTKKQRCPHKCLYCYWRD